MIYTPDLTTEEKLRILSDAAKYDVACTSSGSSRSAVKGSLGSTEASGICHAFTGDGRCVSLLKILMTNECAYDCKYCVNRRSNDVKRARFSPDEICSLTIEFYKRNYIEGLFLSSGVFESPNRTMELMYETLYKLRYQYHFLGYIHIKGIPGADEVLIEKVGFLADRMSMNIELPTDAGLKNLAPSKNKARIMDSIAHIRDGIQGDANYGKSAYETTRMRFHNGAFTSDIHALWERSVPKAELETGLNSQVLPGGSFTSLPATLHREDRGWLKNGRLSSFVPAGQSTQMIIGATGETDLDIIRKAEELYTGYTMKRVFYSAFINTTYDPSLPDTPEGPPLLREHRLYQADFLLRYYGFMASEIVTPDHPNMNLYMDPKCNWALRHLDLFPVEITKADYATLLRVPGIGAKSAERIAKMRDRSALDYEGLKRLGVVLKRAHYFILLNGKQMFRTKLSENFITNELIAMDREKNWKIARNENFRQMDLFRDLGVSMGGVN